MRVFLLPFLRVTKNKGRPQKLPAILLFRGLT